MLEELEPGSLQNGQVVLQVVAVLGPTRVAQQGSQRVEHSLQVELWIAGRGHDRNIVAPLGAVGEGDADQFGLHGIGVSGLRVECERRAAR